MASRPVPNSFRPADRVVVPVQGTDREFLAQQWAVEFAAGLNVPLHAFHVAPPIESKVTGTFSFLDAECRKWGVKFSARHLVGQDVVVELLKELEPRDLVVVGTRRLAAGPQYHVGSVAGELVRRAPCPVQIVRLE